MIRTYGIEGIGVRTADTHDSPDYTFEAWTVYRNKFAEYPSSRRVIKVEYHNKENLVEEYPIHGWWTIV